jgi:uncharacterized membrane protein
VEDVPEQRTNRIETLLERLDPFWAPQLVVAGALILDLSLPEKFTIGPTWLLPAVEGLLLVGLVAMSPNRRMRHSSARRNVAMFLIGLVSAVNLFSLVELCRFLLRHDRGVDGHRLILTGVVLWVTNVLLFGLWYWQLDRGGPVARALNENEPPDFLFQQMTDDGARFAHKDWKPTLIDYLYVSFTNATAFSPTDTMPLTPTAKLMMATQSLASLVTIGLVIARAVGILGGPSP